MRIAVLSALVLLAAGVMCAPAEAGCGPCMWILIPQINLDPPPVYRGAASRTPVPWTPCMSGPDHVGIEPTWSQPIGLSVPTWAWRSMLDAGPWTIAADCRAYSYQWGFASVSASLSGAGQWLVKRVQNCCRPKEDIEVVVRQQFHVEGALDADEKLEVRGAVRFWCANTVSKHNPGKAVNSLAAGGVSIDDDYDDEDTLVGVELGGLEFNVVAASGGSRADDPRGFDAGDRGYSPETISTSTHVAYTMDLDSWDTCSGALNGVLWYVTVVATCDGCCKGRQTMMAKNTYPAE